MKMLLFDCHYLCHRAWFALIKEKNLDLRASMVPPMFFRDIEAMVDRFGADVLVFAFDSQKSYRSEIYAPYKVNRIKEDTTEEDRRGFALFKEHLARIRDEMLPDLGYQNVFKVDGYEADDILAKICKDKSPADDAVVITSDADLYQCLEYPNVLWHSPKTGKTENRQSIEKKLGLAIQDYWKVKCLAGCPSDNVPGMYSVGEKKAVQYLTGTMKKTGKTYKQLADEGMDYILKNAKLVRIPYPGLPIFEIKEDTVNENAKAKILDQLSVKPRRMGGFA